MAAGDQAGIERVVGYMTRCPFSLSRLVKVTDTGQVIYKAEKDACRPFPDPHRADLFSGVKRNFQVLSPLEFLAEFAQHIPPKGSHLVRYYGWYSTKARGTLRKAAEAAAAAAQSPGVVLDVLPVPTRGVPGTRVGPSQTWAMLMKRVFEIDPLACPKCGSQMKVVAFIEPPQGEVIEKILRHCGLWRGTCLRVASPRPPPSDGGVVYVPDDDWGSQTAFPDRSGEVTFVPDPDWESQAAASDEPWEVTYCDADVFDDTLEPSF